MARRKKKTKLKISWKVWAAVIGLFVLIGAFGGGEDASTAPAATNEPVRAAATAVPVRETKPTPEPTETPEPTVTPYLIHYMDPQTIVYVSNKNIIHFDSSCSGMKHYREMTLEKADKAGYEYCSKCG